MDEMRLIDAYKLKSLIEDFPEWMKFDKDRVIKIIDNAPTVKLTEEQAIDKLHETGWMQNHDREMTEQPTGEWEKFEKCGMLSFLCRKCHHAYTAKYNFCPHCGEKKRKGGDGE